MKPIFVGFDGFIDTLLECVETRTSKDSFRPIQSITNFSRHIQKSTNIECVVKQKSLGGNAPLLAQTLLSLHCPVELVASCGFPEIHPLFTSLETIHSISNPGMTDALEFSDGNLLLGKMNEIGTMSLQNLISRVPNLSSLVSHSSILATVNWTMMPLVEQFWEWLLSNHNLITKKTYLFVDLSDPKKRTLTDLMKACKTLSCLNHHCQVILSLNQAESEQVVEAHKLSKNTISQMSQDIRSHLALTGVIIHTQHEVAGSTSFSHSSLLVPHCENPYRTTGAGDNFNAGILFGLLNQKELSEILKIGIKTAEIWIRTGKSATPETLEKFSSLGDKYQ